jgi:bifunctional UDP-N-acetylglucosamine pyrophosphorylase/glucosamine-1-phosphate N-acetyltransferase
MPVYAIVLAAGEGTRMRSQRPKPLHLICGRPMVMHELHALENVRPDRAVVVVGHGADKVVGRVGTDAPSWLKPLFAEQTVQRGTGDAVMVGLAALDLELGRQSNAADELDDTSTIVVLPGDTPLLRRETIDDLVSAHESQGHAATVLVSHVDDPSGYGRVVRGRDGRVERIVEQRDATDDERRITEINTSIYAFRRDLLATTLRVSCISPTSSPSWPAWVTAWGPSRLRRPRRKASTIAGNWPWPSGSFARAPTVTGC